MKEEREEGRRFPRTFFEIEFWGTAVASKTQVIFRRTLHSPPYIPSSADCPLMKVAVVAFGSRGDVQPLAILAGGLASRAEWCNQVVLCCHQQHTGFVTALLAREPCRSNSYSQPQIVAVESPPVLWKGQPVYDFQSV